MRDLISRTQAIDALDEQIKFCDNALCDFNISLKDEYAVKVERASLCAYKEILEDLPPAQPEDYTELKREFLRMASYIDVLLECSDEQKKTLIGFISRLAEFMPWTERD